MPAEAAPPWARLTTLGLPVAGLAVAGYLTVEHFTQGTTLACPANAALDCLKVTTSKESVLLGILVALLGLLYFGAMVALTVPVAWRWGALNRVRLGAGIVGVIAVIYLVYAELFLVDSLCLWCTAIHVITVTLFGILVYVATADA